MATATLRQRLRYWFDNTMSKGTPALVAWLALASLTVVVIGGLLFYLLDPTPQGADEERGLLESLWQGVLHALDPGTVAGDDGHWWFVAIGFVVTIGGILIVTAFIGVLTTGLDAKLTELRKGRSRVLERNHTVVLGWSDQVFTLISELVEANANQRRPSIAILADRDKVEMEDEIRAKVADTRNTRVVCRTGSPIDPDDIMLVNPGEARSVIILSEADSDRDAHLIKSLLAVSKSRQGQSASCHVVGCVGDSKNLPAAKLAGGPSAHIIDATDVAARLIVQTCLQSGLSVVYSDLLDFGGDEIYFHREPRMVGSTYGHALHGFRKSSIIGVLLGDGRVVLNPPSHYQIRDDDQLIAISEDDDTIVPEQPALVVQQAIIAQPDPPPVRRRTLVLGWNHHASGVGLEPPRLGRADAARPLRTARLGGPRRGSPPRHVT
jgi:ion channel POLLUX/CASTOR